MKDFLHVELCVKSVCIQSYSGPCFPAFGMNAERCGISLRIQSECGKIRTRITPNTDTFRAVERSLGRGIERIKIQSLNETLRGNYEELKTGSKELNCVETIVEAVVQRCSTIIDKIFVPKNYV